MPPPDCTLKDVYWCLVCKKPIAPKKHNVMIHGNTRIHKEKENTMQYKDEVLSHTSFKVEPNRSVPVEKVELLNFNKDPNNEQQSIHILACEDDIVSEAFSAIYEPNPPPPGNNNYEKKADIHNRINPRVVNTARMNPSNIFQLEPPSNPDRSFLLSLVDDLKSLPARDKMTFKLDVLQLIEQLLYENR